MLYIRLLLIPFVITLPLPPPPDHEDNGADDDDDDIYIMMKCLCVTKNDHLLKRPLCLFVYFNGLSSLRK